LPHPRASIRRFVLLPLAELGPQWKLPGWSETVSVLLDRLPPGPEARLLEPASFTLDWNGKRSQTGSRNAG